MSEEALTDEFYERARVRLEGRLKPKRYEHSLSVSQMAVEIARAYGVDDRRARIAGLLHDWDKNYKDYEIRARAIELGVEVPRMVLEDMPHLLHGPTAARALAREYPEIDADVLRAIDRHTSAAVDMAPLDMVIYVADAIEPLRPFSDMAHLRAAVGEMDLEELFFETLQHVMAFLVGKGKTMHPNTVNVWNHYALRRGRACEGTKRPDEKRKESK